MAGNFRGRKLSQIGENFIFKLSQIARFSHAKGCHAPNFVIFAYNHKTAKFAPSKVFRYTVIGA